jgi:hypothetical protein
MIRKLSNHPCKMSTFNANQDSSSDNTGMVVTPMGMCMPMAMGMNTSVLRVTGDASRPLFIYWQLGKVCCLISLFVKK